jgi:desulfoferrodoxin (superoxide reductase-like protein)
MKTILFIIVSFFLGVTTVSANKTKAEISAPAEAEKGSEVNIVIYVTHNGNSKTHFTNQVILKINGAEVTRWEYNKQNLPADGNFKLEYTITADEDLLIETEGNCNLHGSTGKNTVTVKVL